MLACTRRVGGIISARAKETAIGRNRLLHKGQATGLAMVQIAANYLTGSSAVAAHQSPLGLATRVSIPGHMAVFVPATTATVQQGNARQGTLARTATNKCLV